jgi:hypothetical protein
VTRMVHNMHERTLLADARRVGALLDSLGSPQDRLWPQDRWPVMRFDRLLQVGAIGGHGPIRYIVERYEPGCAVWFRLTEPAGFEGGHGFDLEPTASGGTRLRHVLTMDLRGTARVSWPLIFRPLHDALVEDVLDRAAVAVGDPPYKRGWSPWVRVLRATLRRRRRSQRAA